jgi:hypothetical protein
VGEILILAAAEEFFTYIHVAKLSLKHKDNVTVKFRSRHAFASKDVGKSVKCDPPAGTKVPQSVVAVFGNQHGRARLGATIGGPAEGVSRTQFYGRIVLVFQGKFGHMNVCKKLLGGS